MVDQRDAPARVDEETHAVRDVLAHEHLRRAPREQVLLRDEALAVREHALRELQLHVPAQIVRARPHSARRASGNDRLVQVHARDRGLPSTSSPCGCASLPCRARAKSNVVVCVIPSGPKTACASPRRRRRRAPCPGSTSAAADETRRRGHEVAVLEDLAELARRLHRAEQLQRGHGRRLAELEEPLEILPRHPVHAHTRCFTCTWLRGRGVAELEGRIDLDRPARPSAASSRPTSSASSSVVNLVRLAGAHPTAALSRANAKFERRFTGVEALAAERGIVFGRATLEELDVLWDEVKRRERAGASPAGADRA